MPTVTQKRAKTRSRRKKHIRKIVTGTAARPRLVIYRSVHHVYAQLVDDVAGRTLFGVSSLTPGVREQLSGKKPSEVCEIVGQAVAKKAIEHQVTSVVFDRNGFPYHGRVKAMAEGARKGGLQF